MHIINISDPASPKRIGGAMPPAVNEIYSTGLTLHGNYAYVSLSNDYERGLIQAFDISVIATPQYVADIPAANHQTLAASGDYLYLANGIEGLKVIRRDIHLLQAKINDWGIAPESSTQINRGLIHGNLAFAAENNTFQIFDT